MKVAYLVTEYPRTSHSFIRREIQALEAHGATVLRYSLRPVDVPLATAADREEAGRTRIVLGAGLTGHAAAMLSTLARSPRRLWRALALAVRLGRRSDRGLALHLVYLAEACVLARWLRAEGAEHVHAHFGTNSTAVALLAHALGGPPYSFTVHGPDEFDRPGALKLGEKIAHARFVAAVSSYGRSQCFRWAHPDDWPKVQVIRCGLEAALLRAPPTPVPAAPRFVCVARLSEQKGHLLLLEAAARLAAEGRRFEVVLAGDGPLRGRIEARIAALGLERHVRVAGWMGADEVKAALLSSRASVLPSFAEGLPVTLMESLALGRPVITTAIAGIPELVEHGVSGWVVPAGAVEPLAQALREALDASEARLGEMGRAGARAVVERHDAAREAARLLALFAAPAPDAAEPLPGPATLAANG